MTEILTHPLWPAFRPFLKIEKYNRDANKSGTPRARLNFHKLPTVLDSVSPKFSVPCVACGAPINPIRKRGSNHHFLAITCPLAVSIACARSKKTRGVYAEIEKDYLNNLPTTIEVSSASALVKAGENESWLI